jgi:hypothetical protein
VQVFSEKTIPELSVLKQEESELLDENAESGLRNTIET